MTRLKLNSKRYFLLGLILTPVFLIVRRQLNTANVSSPQGRSMNIIQPQSRMETTSSALTKNKTDVKLQYVKNNCDLRLAANGTFPAVALVSAPGSGNTWIRHLLQQATGYYTGSIFTDEALYKAGFLGEYEDWDSGSTLVVKTHTRGLGQIKKYPAGILIIRNLYDSTISERNLLANYLNEHDHLGIADWGDQLTRDPEWIKFVDDRIKSYENRIRRWVEWDIPLLIVHYENVVQDPEVEVKKMTDFLNVPLTNERMACVRMDTQGGFHRVADKAWKKAARLAFTHEMRQRINQVMENMSKLLVEHGHSKLPWPLYENMKR
ncbi:sialate:O-sulfotransferase 1-like [Saccoglossus kowalevskii]